MSSNRIDTSKQEDEYNVESIVTDRVSHYRNSILMSQVQKAIPNVTRTEKRSSLHTVLDEISQESLAEKSNFQRKQVIIQLPRKSLHSPEIIVEECVMPPLPKEKLLTDSFVRKLPVPITEKRHYRKSILVSLKRKSFFSEFNDTVLKKWDDFVSYFDLWHESLSIIEGQHGSAVVSYFLFIRWLLYMNFIIFCLNFIFLVMPQILFPTTNNAVINHTLSYLVEPPASIDEKGLRENLLKIDHYEVNQREKLNLMDLLPDELNDYNGSNVTNSTSVDAISAYCGALYAQQILNDSRRTGFFAAIQNFLQGTGPLEPSHLFMGFYSPFNIIDDGIVYQMPIAFLCVLFATFSTCFFMMMQYSSTGIQEAFTARSKQSNHYSNAVFSAWEYGIKEFKSAAHLQYRFVLEMKTYLSEDHSAREMTERSTSAWMKLYLVRFLINGFVLVWLISCCYLIYSAAAFQMREQQTKALSKPGFQTFFVQFLPSITIVALNSISPTVFNKLKPFEKHSAETEMNISILRNEVLYLSSVIVLLNTFYRQVACKPKDVCGAGLDVMCRSPRCWETYIGQQLYKLSLTNMFVIVVLFLCNDCLRYWISRKFKSGFAKLIGPPIFFLPTEVLAAVNSQTFLWLGVFYSPFLPALIIFHWIVIFHIKKVKVLKLCGPSESFYRASRVNSVFTLILLISFFVVLVVQSFAIERISPSKGCGPFRYLNYMTEAVPTGIRSWLSVLMSYWTITFVILILCIWSLADSVDPERFFSKYNIVVMDRRMTLKQSNVKTTTSVTSQLKNFTLPVSGPESNHKEKLASSQDKDERHFVAEMRNMVSARMIECRNSVLASQIQKVLPEISGHERRDSLHAVLEQVSEDSLLKESKSKQQVTFQLRKKSTSESSEVLFHEYVLSGTKDKLLTDKFVRNLTVPIRDKRHYRNSIEISLKRMPWYIKFHNCLARKYENFQHWFDFWNETLKLIEGHHGASTLAYFLFLRWLLYINIIIFLLNFFFLVIPQLLFSDTFDTNYLKTADLYVNDSNFVLTSSDILTKVSFTGGENLDYSSLHLVTKHLDFTSESITNVSSVHVLSEICHKLYHYQVNRAMKADFLVILQNLLQGTGPLEVTLLFIGYYPRFSFWKGENVYDVAFAFMCVLFATFIICLIMMINYSSIGIQEAAQSKRTNYYTNEVFSAWDFCIDDPTSAYLQHSRFFLNVKASLHEDRSSRKYSSKTSSDWRKLYVSRFVINVVIILWLFCSLYLIYLAAQYQIKESQKRHLIKPGLQTLFVQFLPSITVVTLNVISPSVFDILVSFEQYSSQTTVNLSIFRNVFLYLSSIIVLLNTIQSNVDCKPKDLCGVGLDQACRSPICWETYVGQQLYKLTIVDMSVYFAVFIGYDLVQYYLTRNFDNQLTRFWGHPIFFLQTEVLAPINSQTILWLGVFYSPLLPALMIFKILIIFQIKKFKVLKLCDPADDPYRTSKFNAVFSSVLFISFFCALMVHGFAIEHISPSRGCGPFQHFNSMLEAIPETIRNCLSFLMSYWAILFATLLLCLAINYYWGIIITQKELAKRLRSHLVLQSFDKQFLLKSIADLSKDKPSVKKTDPYRTRK